MTRREILRRYRHLRAIVTHHHSAALKFLTPEAIIERARRLGLAAGQALITDNEKEATLLFDLVIYAAREGRSRAIDRYARAAKLPAGSDGALMLEAMRHARFSLWRVERRQPKPDRLDEDSRLATDIYRAAVDHRLMDRIAFR